MSDETVEIIFHGGSAIWSNLQKLNIIALVSKPKMNYRLLDNSFSNRLVIRISTSLYDKYFYQKVIFPEENF